MQTGRLLSVNVGRIREFEFRGKPARSAIWKTPVDGRVLVHGVNLDGDDQADRDAHGGVDKVVYSYAKEDLVWWEQELGHPLDAGVFGENLTTEGVSVSGALIGERWRIGTTLLEVSEPRVPCWRLGVRMNDQLFLRHFTEAQRPGCYLRIVEAGELGIGDDVHVVGRPDHGVSVQDVFRIFSRDRHESGQLLAVPQLSSAWKAWAQKQQTKTAFKARK